MAVYGENPFVRVPADYPDDRFYDLVYWKAVVNAHGPIWRVLEAISAQVGGERCVSAILAMKVWPTLAYLGDDRGAVPDAAAACPERALDRDAGVRLVPAGRSSKRSRTATTTWWRRCRCCWRCGRRASVRWRLAVVLVAVGFLVKPLAAVAGPVLLVAAWRAGPAARREVGRSAWLWRRCVVVAGVRAVLRRPQTFQGLERGSIFSASPAELVVIGAGRAPAGRSTARWRRRGCWRRGGVRRCWRWPRCWALWRGRLTLASALAAVLFALPAGRLAVVQPVVPALADAAGDAWRRTGGCARWRSAFALAGAADVPAPVRRPAGRAAGVRAGRACWPCAGGPRSAGRLARRLGAAGAGRRRPGWPVMADAR